MSIFLFAASAALALGACSGGADDGAANETDLAVNNLIVDDPAAANALMEGDMNAIGDMNATLDANMGGNLIEEDLTTNDADANLANGL